MKGACFVAQLGGLSSPLTRRQQMIPYEESFYCQRFTIYCSRSSGDCDLKKQKYIYMHKDKVGDKGFSGNGVHLMQPDHFICPSDPRDSPAGKW